MNTPLVVLTIVAIVMSAVGQIALKLAVERANLEAAFAAGPMAVIAAAATSLWLWGALFIYGVAVVLWLWVLSKLDVSLAYPLVSLGFIITLGFAAVFLNEPITPLRIGGVLLIVAGCFMVSRSA